MQRDRRGGQCALLTTSQSRFIFDQEEKKWVTNPNIVYFNILALFDIVKQSSKGVVA